MLELLRRTDLFTMESANKSSRCCWLRDTGHQCSEEGMNLKHLLDFFERIQPLAH